MIRNLKSFQLRLMLTKADVAQVLERVIIISWKVGGSIPDSSDIYAEVPLGKILNTMYLLVFECVLKQKED